MKFEELIKKTANLPYFSTRFLAAGQNLAQVRVQLDRWEKGGRIFRLGKGLYTIAEPYSKIKPDNFQIANKLRTHSYVSLQSALSWYGMIPEFVPIITSVTTGRPGSIENALGSFEYRHIGHKLFFGYQNVELSSGQWAFVARPEKALLDLIHLTAGGETKEYLEELRLQNSEKLNNDILDEYAERSKSLKLKRAVLNIKEIIEMSQGIEL
jgi:predicted transcriptional regulator of viral defense system